MAIQTATEFETERPRLALDGTWDFSYDPEKQGVREKWFSASHQLPERIIVPGCSQSRAFRSSASADTGKSHGPLPEQKEGFLLRHACFADGWWKRTVTVPVAWKGKRILLHIGGVKPAAKIWVNGVRMGQTIMSRSAIECDITRAVRFGEPCTVAVRVFRPNWRSEVYGMARWDGVASTVLSGWKLFRRHASAMFR